MIDLTKLTTEQRNPLTMELDSMDSIDIVHIMNDEDMKAVQAVATQDTKIAQAIDIAASALMDGGRIIYIGAGTSGRLGVLDAVECPPTFGVDPSKVVGLIAGGEKAFIKAQEGVEDSDVAPIEDLKAINLSNKDVVIGLAASGRTPYVIAGLNYARSVGSPTVSIACNKEAKISKEADLSIEAVVGPEVLTGSTRLKAGTAQKLILNMISTGAMVKCGKAFQNLMVDVQQTNEKLHVRAQNIVIEATGCTREEASQALEASGGSVKTAIVSIILDCAPNEAKAALETSNGHVREAIKINKQ